MAMMSEDYRRGQLDALESVLEWAYGSHRHGEGALLAEMPDGRTIEETLEGSGVEVHRFEIALSRELGGSSVPLAALGAYVDGRREGIAEDIELKTKDALECELAWDLMTDLDPDTLLHPYPDGRAHCEQCGRTVPEDEHAEGCPVPGILGVIGRFTQEDTGGT